VIESLLKNGLKMF